jgi:hypothetical protein
VPKLCLVGNHVKHESLVKCYFHCVGSDFFLGLLYVFHEEVCDGGMLVLFMFLLVHVSEGRFFVCKCVMFVKGNL